MKELTHEELQHISGGALATSFVAPTAGASLASSLARPGSTVAIRCCATHCCSSHLPALQGLAGNPAGQL